MAEDSGEEHVKISRRDHLDRTQEKKPRFDWLTRVVPYVALFASVSLLVYLLIPPS